MQPDDRKMSSSLEETGDIPPPMKSAEGKKNEASAKEAEVSRPMLPESTRPAVVVGIVTHNRVKLLLKAIASVREQSYARIRLHVYDDCSTDGTNQLELSSQIATWETSASQVGYLWARNHMMGLAVEDYYVSLDDDAWFIEGDEIDIAVRFLENNPKVGAVAFDILTPDASTIRSRGEARFAAMFIGCGHVIRLKLAKEIGGYKAYPGRYGGEEQDFCLKLLDMGYSVVRLPGVHVWHDKTMLGRDLGTQQRSGVCNDLGWTVVRFPAALILPAMLWKFMAHLRFARANGLLQPTMGGIFDFVRSLRRLVELREPVSYKAIFLARKFQGSGAPTPLDTWKKYDRTTATSAEERHAEGGA
jgi:GT2 family glycosyltransferase